jgi:hypothetical protein
MTTEEYEYETGKDKVTAILKKTLGSGISNEISYETRLNGFNETFNGSTITLEIEKLRTVKLGEHWDDKQPNANKLLANKTATLVIYYGNVDSFGINSKQVIQISKDSIFITWRVESAEYISSIATSLKQNNEASVKIDLAVDDDYFANEETTYKTEINKISITFN